MSHGTVSKYNQGCRCAECSEAKAQYNREYRQDGGRKSPDDTAPETVEAIRQFIRDRGYPPTITELAERLDVTRGTAGRRLTTAEELGLIERVPNRSRAITIKETP